jgi:hypothetical protein
LGYNLAKIFIVRPYLDGSLSDVLNAKDISRQAALNISSLTTRLSNHYVIQCIPYGYHMIVNACLVHIFNLDQRGCAEAYCDGTRILGTRSPAIPFTVMVSRGLAGLRNFYGLQVPKAFHCEPFEPSDKLPEDKVGQVFSQYPFWSGAGWREGTETEAAQVYQKQEVQDMVVKDEKENSPNGVDIDLRASATPSSHALPTNKLRKETPDVQGVFGDALLGRMDDLLRKWNAMSIEEEPEDSDMSERGSKREPHGSASASADSRNTGPSGRFQQKRHDGNG